MGYWWQLTSFKTKGILQSYQLSIKLAIDSNTSIKQSIVRKYKGAHDHGRILMSTENVSNLDLWKVWQFTNSICKWDVYLLAYYLNYSKHYPYNGCHIPHGKQCCMTTIQNSFTLDSNLGVLIRKIQEQDSPTSMFVLPYDDYALLVAYKSLI